ncbi:MAG: hypothetical protein KGK34_10385 [Chloroflexota bacterium]|nr:hypothetical protein [Chloroflexota bacterium]
MRSQFLTTMIQLASAAFGVVAALAWNAFITELVKAYLPAQAGLVGLFIYAVVVTIVAVIVLTSLGRAAERAGGKSAV